MLTQVACGGGEGADVPSSAMNAAVMAHDASQARAPALNAADCPWVQEDAQPAETFSGCQALAMDMPTARRGLSEGFIPQNDAPVMDPRAPLPSPSNLAFDQQALQPADVRVVEAPLPYKPDATEKQVEVAVVAGVDAAKRAPKPLISLKDL